MSATQTQLAFESALRTSGAAIITVVLLQTLIKRADWMSALTTQMAFAVSMPFWCHHALVKAADPLWAIDSS